MAIRQQNQARRPRGERLIYSLADRGRKKLGELVQQVLRTYEPVPSNVGAAVVFLPSLLAERRIPLHAPG